MLHTNIIPDGSNNIQTHSDLVQDIGVFPLVTRRYNLLPWSHTAHSFVLFWFRDPQQQKLYAVHLTISKNVLNKIIGIVFSH